MAARVRSWLNEGWTVYLERRILAAMHGEPEFHFSSIIGWKGLGESCRAAKGGGGTLC